MTHDSYRQCIYYRVDWWDYADMTWEVGKGTHLSEVQARQWVTDRAGGNPPAHRIVRVTQEVLD